MSERSTSAAFRALLGRLRAFKVEKFSRSDAGFGDPETEKEVDSLEEANVASSLLKEKGRKYDWRGGDRGFEPIESYDQHVIVLDIDYPAHLVPSSTPGHSHLYVEIPPVSSARYFEFLRACADVGLISDGYAEASKRRGHSDVRLPWIKKGDTP